MDPLVALRGDVQRLTDRLPEPPLYARAVDPERLKAVALQPEVEALLRQARGLEIDGVQALREQLEAYALFLRHVSESHVVAAERAYSAARSAERRSRDSRRRWRRTDEQVAPVFDRATRRSRYDPADAPTFEVSLTCPNAACRTVHRYASEPTAASRRFVCPHCQVPFLAFLGETRAARHLRQGNTTHYEFLLDDVTGHGTRVVFDDGGTDLVLVSAPGDLLAFLYADDRSLLGVTNLTTDQRHWVARTQPCFLATAALGPSAPELRTFRAFRDDVLVQWPWGRRAVALYYLHGARWAAALESRPVVRWMLRGALRALHRAYVNLWKEPWS